MAHPLYTLYKGLAYRIKDKIPAFRHIALYNGQFDNEEIEKSFPYPCIFIHFENVEWIATTNKTQQGDIDITFYIGVENYKDEISKPFELLESVYKYLQGVNGLNRVSEEQDVNHDNVIVFKSMWRINIIDDNAVNPDNHRSVSLTTLALNYDLDIDNSDIRTGDGEF